MIQLFQSLGQRRIRQIFAVMELGPYHIEASGPRKNSPETVPELDPVKNLHFKRMVNQRIHWGDRFGFSKLMLEPD